MAVKTMTKEKPAITTERIDAAKAKAINLCAEAYAPKPIPQPDGSTLSLCWHGRILRAIDVLDDVRKAGDVARMAKVQSTLKAFRESYDTAAKAAENAAADWAALCTAGGIACDPLEVYPPDCDCIMCRKQRSMGMYRSAVVRARMAVEAFLCPGVDTPPVVTLTETAKDASSRDHIYRHLVGIAKAFRDYEGAAKEAGITVDWRELL